MATIDKGAANGVHTGGPAFPAAGYDERGPGHDGQAGMSLRDYFAGQALGLGGEWFNKSTGWTVQDVATYAYRVADAMLEARQRAGRAE